MSIDFFRAFYGFAGSFVHLCPRLLVPEHANKPLASGVRTSIQHLTRADSLDTDLCRDFRDYNLKTELTVVHSCGRSQDRQGAYFRQMMFKMASIGSFFP